jgi:hypothetical protein
LPLPSIPSIAMSLPRVVDTLAPVYS